MTSGKTSETGKVTRVRVKFTDGTERWVPRKMILGGDVRRKGDQGTLAVKPWIVKQWDGEDPLQRANENAPVCLPGDVIVLSESAKALDVEPEELVRTEAGDE